MNKPLSQSAEDLENYALQKLYYSCESDQDFSRTSSPLPSICFRQSLPARALDSSEYFLGVLTEADAEATEKKYIDEESASDFTNPLFIASLPSGVFVPTAAYTGFPLTDATPTQSSRLPKAELVSDIQKVLAPQPQYSFRIVLIGLIASALAYISGYSHGALYQQRKAHKLPSIDFEPLSLETLKVSVTNIVAFSSKAELPANVIANPRLRKRF